MTKRLTLRILVHDKLFTTELGRFRASRYRISDSCAIYACGGSTINSKILHIPKGSLHSECLGMLLCVSGGVLAYGDVIRLSIRTIHNLRYSKI